MKKLLPAAVVGILMLTGCSHNASSNQPAQAPTPPTAVKALPSSAQSAISSAIPAGDLKNVQPKAQ